MLQINKRAPLSNQSSGKLAAPLFDGVNFAVRIVRRQLPIVSVIMLCSLALALLYLFSTPPMFTAGGAMVIDTRKVQILQMGAQNQSVLGDLQIDASTVQTQVEVLKSDNISLAVIRKLRLTEDPEFVGPGKGIISRVLGFVLGPGKPRTDYEIEQAALGYFNGQRTVTREGLTYVIEIGFTSQNPETAAKIVNAIVAAYVRRPV
jgi:succinoglycan biosynthesis transport protein ExoP